jgi:hypothetical protein
LRTQLNKEAEKSREADRNREAEKEQREHQDRKKDSEEKCLTAFSGADYKAQKNTSLRRERRTCLWFLHNPKFLD